MSFVNLVITDQFISVLSDGQVTQDSQIIESHFKKFETSPQGFVIAITGFEKITNDIRKKFYYQPQLNFDEAKALLLQELEHYAMKHLAFSGLLSFNALMAGFVSTESGQKEGLAYTFHVENGQITEKSYKKSAVLSLLPDDISFNPNLIISTHLADVPKAHLAFHIPNLQRNALYQVANASKTVNHVYFQDIIKKD